MGIGLLAFGLFWLVAGLQGPENPTSIPFFARNIVYTYCSSGCDYNNLQTAISALPSDGGKIVIKNVNTGLAGHYNITSNTIIEFAKNARLTAKAIPTTMLQINGKQNVEIINANITMRGGGGTGISCISSSNVTISGGFIDVLDSNPSHSIYGESCKHVSIHDVHIKTARLGIQIITTSHRYDDSCDDIWASNNKVENWSHFGILVNFCSNVHINYNDVIGPNGISNDNAIDIGGNKDSEIRGNTVTAGPSVDDGINTDRATRALIIGNMFKGPGGAGVNLCGATDITVKRNTIATTGGNGISVIACSVQPSQNIVEENMISGAADYGIYVIRNAPDNVIRNNIIKSWTISCILIQTPNPTVTNENNVCN